MLKYTIVQGDPIDRLAAYESTDKEPDEIKKMEEQMQKLQLELAIARKQRDEALTLLCMADYSLWQLADCQACINKCVCMRNSFERRKCSAGNGNFKCNYTSRYEALKKEVVEDLKSSGL